MQIISCLDLLLETSNPLSTLDAIVLHFFLPGLTEFQRPDQ